MIFFKFQYLKNKKTYIYFIVIVTVLISLGIAYYLVRERNIRDNILSFEKLPKVNLFYVTPKNDTINFITVIEDYELRDSLLGIAKKEFEDNVVQGNNFTNFKVNKDSIFYYIGQTKDTLICEVTSINKVENMVKRYYVYYKAIHNYR